MSKIFQLPAGFDPDIKAAKPNGLPLELPPLSWWSKFALGKLSEIRDGNLPIVFQPKVVVPIERELD